MDLRPKPLNERRSELARLLQRAPDGLWLSINVEAEQGPALLRHACAMNLEGVVSKRRDRPYRSGQCRVCVNVKCSEYVRPRAREAQLHHPDMVPVEGLEPPTYRLQGGCSTS